MFFFLVFVSIPFLCEIILKIDHTCTATNQKSSIETFQLFRFWGTSGLSTAATAATTKGAHRAELVQRSKAQEGCLKEEKMEYPQDCKVVVLGTTGVRYITHSAVVNLICGGVVWCDTPLLTALINEGRYNISIYLFCLFPHLLFFKKHTPRLICTCIRQLQRTVRRDDCLKSWMPLC